MGKSRSSKGTTNPLKLSAIEKQFAKKLQEKAGEAPFTPSLATWNSICGFKHVKDVVKILDKLVCLGKLYKSKKKYSFSEIPEVSETCTDQDSIYTDEYRKELSEEIKKYSKFIITTAVSGKEVNEKFVEAIKSYAKQNNALKLVFPCEDVASRGKKAKAIDLSPSLSDFRVIFKDTYLNSNLCLCAIKVSAKQINSLTGLDRLATKRDASIIVGATKHFLHYIPNMHDEVPLAAMTTGAVTTNNYDNDRWMCKRMSTIAENDHMYGAVIVELEDDKIFHFRHIKAAQDGSFTDLGVTYNPNGTTKRVKESVLVMGDSHVGYHDKELFRSIMSMSKDTNVSTIVLHDIFNATSITHHDKDKDIERAIKAEQGLLSLKFECSVVQKYLELVASIIPNVVIVPANHNSHLEKYLQSSRYVKDPMNYSFSLPLAAAMLERKNPLKVAIEESLEYKNDNIQWLEKDESYKRYGVELGLHGHQGANGAKGSINTFEKGLGNCVTAHTHTACILRDSVSVGTTTLMHLGYNEGLSNWTRTCCLVYPDGTKQLINFILNSKNEYTWEA